MITLYFLLRNVSAEEEMALKGGWERGELKGNGGRGIDGGAQEMWDGERGLEEEWKGVREEETLATFLSSYIHVI